jgi:hypothetical protein
MTLYVTAEAGTMDLVCILPPPLYDFEGTPCAPMPSTSQPGKDCGRRRGSRATIAVGGGEAMGLAWEEEAVGG